jgi:hypothetical protein
VIVTYDTGQARRRPFPAQDTAFVTAWAADNDRLIAGTLCARDGFEQTTPAPVFARADETWSRLGTAPAGVRSLGVAWERRLPSTRLSEQDGT